MLGQFTDNSVDLYGKNVLLVAFISKLASPEGFTSFRNPKLSLRRGLEGWT